MEILRKYIPSSTINELVSFLIYILYYAPIIIVIPFYAGANFSYFYYKHKNIEYS